jgi:hypothetical protein
MLASTISSSRESVKVKRGETRAPLVSFSSGSPAPLAVRGGLWFQCGAQQVHIGIEKDFRAAKKAHPAIRQTDEASVEALKTRLRAAGVATRDDREIEDASRFFADDPWGNRLEFVAAKKPASRSSP